MDMVRFVAPSGEAAGDLPLTTDELVAGYMAMARARRFDERAVVLQRQGRLGVYAPYKGQEAAQVGTAMALAEGDWLVPSYRETAAAMVHGLPMRQAILYWRAHAEGWRYPEGVRVLPFYVPIATQLPHAVGLAVAGRHQAEPWTVMAYVGDGGTSEGDFHEALNFAAVYRAPVVFVVQNNGWAISVPTERQMGNQRVADRAVGYGMPGARVDGNDYVACLATAREAVARARAGEGPTLIEAVTYRLSPHTTSDDPHRYRDEDETSRRAAEEPLARLRTLLVARGAWDEGREAALMAELERELQEALAEADAAPEPAAASVVEHVFETPGPDQRRALEALRGG